MSTIDPISHEIVICSGYTPSDMILSWINVISYFPVREIYVQTSGFHHLHHHHHPPRNGKSVYYSGLLFRIYFYRESSGNIYLPAISDHNMLERQNYYFRFFSGESKWSEVKWNMKIKSWLFVSFLYLEVFRLCLFLSLWHRCYVWKTQILNKFKNLFLSLSKDRTLPGMIQNVVMASFESIFMIFLKHEY